jgi:hypothetical protein
MTHAIGAPVRDFDQERLKILLVLMFDNIALIVAFLVILDVVVFVVLWIVIIIGGVNDAQVEAADLIKGYRIVLLTIRGLMGAVAAFETGFVLIENNPLFLCSTKSDVLLLAALRPGLAFRVSIIRGALAGCSV